MILRTLLALSVLIPFVAQADAEQARDRDPFARVEIYIDTKGLPLAAWQVELVCDTKKAKITGVEGDDTKAYGNAPYYDPAALQGGRIILAAFTTADNPPSGRIRVATVEMYEEGANPDYSAKLIVAGGPGGQKIDATIEVVRRGGK